MTLTRRLPRDTGLTIRMMISMAALAALYLVFVYVLLNAGVGTFAMVIVLGGFLLVQYYFSDSIVLMSVGARKLKQSDAPELHGIIERLVAMADLPMPKVAIMNTPMPNAFATGRNPQHAAICVTTGLMKDLDRKEIEAVLAHEITHIKNRDMTIMTMAAFFATVAATIVQFAFFFIPMGGMGGGMGGGRRNGNAGALVLLVSFLVWIVSFFLIRAISRYREYAADRGSAILTGDPAQLESALVKISGVMQRIPSRDLRHAENVSALFIFPAVGRGSLMELFQTHPTLAHRLEKLRQIAREMSA